MLVNMTAIKILAETKDWNWQIHQISRVNRLCLICESDQIEDESCFLIYRNKYPILRDEFYIVPPFKQVSSFQAISERVTSGYKSLYQYSISKIPFIYAVSYFQIKPM